MPVLMFPNVNTLRLALTSGLVPRNLATSPVAANHDSHNRVWVQVLQPLTRESLLALGRIGVQVIGAGDVALSEFSCWAAILPLQPANLTRVTKALFTVPDRLLAQFVGRLHRRKCAVIGIQLQESTSDAWVSVVNPPEDLLRATQEVDSDVRAFIEQVPSVWLQYGWQHSAPELLVIPPDCVLFLSPPRNIIAVPDTVPAPAIEDLPLRLGPTTTRTIHQLCTIPVPLTLSRSQTPGVANFWVLDGENPAEFWEYCAQADARILQQLEVAVVTHEGRTRWLVRLSNGKRSRVQWPGLASGYRPDPRVPGLWIPVNCALRPTVRVHELSRYLGINPTTLTWLEGCSPGQVRVHAVPYTVFQPVSKLVEYCAPETVTLLVQPRGEPFPLPRYTVEPSTPTTAQPEPLPSSLGLARPPSPLPTPRQEQSGWLKSIARRLLGRVQQSPTHAVSVPKQPTRPTEIPVTTRMENKLTSTDSLLHGQHWTARRRALEARLFQELPQLGSQERSERWAELAGLYTVTGRQTDAAVCWLNAAWESVVLPLDWLERWLNAERRAAKVPENAIQLEDWLREAERPGLARVIAAYCAWAGHAPTPSAEFVQFLPEIQAVLAQHFDDLPIRAAWLAILGVTRICDGDALGLARWGDRLLHRLAVRGPGLDLDSPSFLRFHGTGSPERFQSARELLIRVHKLAGDWIQDHGGTGRFQREGLDAETECTATYAQFMFSWGLGALGERSRAKEWANRARQMLARSPRRPWVVPAVHAILGDLFLQRVNDAIEGRAPKPILAKEFQARIDQLPVGSIERYSIDVLREHSSILEPLARIRARPDELKCFWGQDRLADRLVVLLARGSLADLPSEARELIGQCYTSPSTEHIPRITLALLELAPWLDHPSIIQLFDLVPQAVDWVEPWITSGARGHGHTPESLTDRVIRYQARLIEAAMSAGALLPSELGQPAITQMLRRLEAFGEVIRPPFFQIIRTVFRVLRRHKLPHVAEHLVRFLNPLPSMANDEVPLPIRLGLATGWFTAGDTDIGLSILDEARNVLYQRGARDIRSHTTLAIAYAHTLGFAPPQWAYGRLEELFQRDAHGNTRLGCLAVSGGTNRYYTLQPLQMIDAVVQAVVNDEFTLEAGVRNWLDDDEFLIRNRIHRDLSSVLRTFNLS